jgi:hypothetical protein
VFGLWKERRFKRTEQMEKSQPPHHSLGNNMDLNAIIKAREEVDSALNNLMTLMYGAGVNQRWVAFSDRLDANSDQRLVAFAISDFCSSWDLDGLSRQAFPMIERFVESLR